MTTALHRNLRLALALWLGTLGMAPALSLADNAEGPEGLGTEVPADVAPDAVAVFDPDEIKKILDDLTIYGRYVDGENWIEYHLPDGRTAYWEKGCTYPGKWWMEQGQVCYAYPNYHNNAPNCFVLYRRPGGQIQFVAIADAGFSYLASFSLKTAMGNDAALPIGSLSPCVGA
ncbi:hypothetical protein [Dongia deserti]|uniref:hypothetical protein n=1 Tax=Dongia deserti TaxID=2268030 RepID=UPI000E6488F6|nr:hypothetical protein [Dongia deserti]